MRLFREQSAVAAGKSRAQTGERQISIAVAALAALATLMAAWPPLHLVLVNANLATYYQENIGWRFFWVQRFIDHVPGDFIHPGQGVLLPLVQSIYYLAGKDLLRLDLFGQINLFGHLTLVGAAGGLLVTTLLIAVDRGLDASVRVAFVVTPLVMGLGGLTVFSYDVYPDYLAYEKVAFLFFGWRWTHHDAADGVLSARAAAELGALAGLLAALKLNYAVWPVGLLLVSLTAAANQSWAVVARLGSIMALSATASMASLLLIFYRGNLHQIFDYFWYLFRWTSLLQPRLDFSLDWRSPVEPTLARLLRLVGLLCLLKLYPVRLKSISLALMGVALGAGATAMAYWRGGGSSYLDAVVMTCVLCPLIAATFESRALVRIASYGLAAFFCLWTGTFMAIYWADYESVAVSRHKPLVTLADAGDWQRGLFKWNVSRGLPIYVLTPTNYEAQGAIEDMIYMGFQNFGGAPVGPAWLQASYPNLHFLYYEDPVDPSYHLTLPAERVVFMRVTGDPAPGFPRIPQKLMEFHDQQIERLLRDRKREECYSVTQFMSRMEIVSCVLSAPE